MSKPVAFEDLSFDEKIDIFIQLISGHDREIEIIHMLALFTAYNMAYETAKEYGLDEHTGDELVEILSDWFVSNEFEYSEAFWIIALRDLGQGKIFDIIDNIKKFVAKYHEMTRPLEELQHELSVMFTRMNSNDL